VSAGKSGPAIFSTPTEIYLEIPDMSIVDAHHFRNATLAALSDGENAVDYSALDKAASLYVGPFLEEYDEDWVLDQRERLQALHLRADPRSC
jgi:DNA-binding SARP family transcriptional activator